MCPFAARRGGRAYGRIQPKMRQEPIKPAPASGRLGVLIVGMGSLSTALIAGVLAVRRNLGKPIGSLTQMGQLPGPSGQPDSVPFGGWDVVSDDAYSAAKKARVLEDGLLALLKSELESIRPWRGIFDPRYLRRIEATHSRPPMGWLGSVEEV